MTREDGTMLKLAALLLLALTGLLPGFVSAGEFSCPRPLVRDSGYFRERSETAETPPRRASRAVLRTELDDELLEVLAETRDIGGTFFVKLDGETISWTEYLKRERMKENTAPAPGAGEMNAPIVIREGTAPEREILVSELKELGYIGDHLLMDSRGKLLLWDEYTDWRRRKAFGRLREDERYVPWNHGSSSIGIVQRKFDYPHDQH